MTNSLDREAEDYIPVHPAYWSALERLENAALHWNALVNKKGPGHEDTIGYYIAMRGALDHLKTVKTLLCIPKEILRIDNEEFLKGCGLRYLKRKDTIL